MPITNGYATLAEVKSALRITDSDDDTRLESAIQRASRWIDSKTGRFFYQVAGTYDYVCVNPYRIRITDLATSAGLVVTSDDNNDNSFSGTWDLNTDYRLEPTEAPAYGLPYGFLYAQDSEFIQDTRVRVQGTFGFPAIPDPIKEACVMLSIRLYKRPDAPLGVAGFGDMGAVMVRGSDADAQALIQPFVRVAIA
jgi:hypothetical protein